MAPKSKPATSKALTTTGPKEVISHPTKGKKREYVEKPTTTRALILRNGKHGAMGTGEIIASNKITGREKLDLLAEELIEKMKTAVMTPFRFENALRLSDSQFGIYRDDIVNLKDPDLFRDIIEGELVARTRPNTEPRRNATNVAKIIGTRVHNSYMLASAWKLVTDTLRKVQSQVVDEKILKSKLKTDQTLRSEYLVLFDLVNHLVDLSHNYLSVLATTAPHYSEYFKTRPSEGSGEPEVIFEWNDKKILRSVTQSFLDSIIIELCFPQSPFPKAVLYQLLKECLDEAPHEGKRFSQAMANAIGDLSRCVELQTLLEEPLLGPEYEQWRNERREMPEAFERWIDAGIFSRQASGEIGNWKDLVYPLGATKKKEVLEKIWKGINLNYIKEAGIDIDRLWALDESLTFKPQWSSYWFEKLAEDSDEEDEDINGLPRAKGQKKKLLALKGPDDDDSADSMPALQSVSNSSDDDDYSEIDSDEEDDDDDYETGESDYDTDEEDEIRELIREAMEAGHEVDWFDSTPADPELDPLKADEKKGNPFLKALGSLRGRLFKSDPKVKPTAARTEPRPNARGAFRATPTGVPKPVPKTAPPKPTPASAKQQQQQQQAPASHKTTMEEVEDEDAVTPSAGKKKKKKKPKKKRTGDEAEAPDSPRPAAAQAAPTSPTSPTLGRSTIGASASTLNIPVETTQAQSSHSYLKQLESDFQQKAKIKSRPDHASIFSGSIHETKKGGLLSKMGFGKKEEDHGDKNPKYTWFSRLSKKATDSMHQLLKTSEDAGRQPAPMKWETFLKLMREMGFEYDPSTAGSSVRFDPPDKRDRSITIHKPHPDPTLNPIMLRNIGKRLKRYYGWNEEDFIKQTQEISSRK